MKITQSYLAILILLLTSCGSEETGDADNLGHNNNSNVSMTSTNTPVQDSILPLEIKTDSIAINQSVLPNNIKKRQEPKAELLEMPREIHYMEERHIISSSKLNTYTQNETQISFLSITKESQDTRVGCSGGENRFSFVVECIQDSFLIENKMLQNIQFKYAVEGGLYFASGENPYKGLIAGKRMPDNTWQLKMDVWLKMKSDVSEGFDKHIEINDTFNP